MSRQGRWTRSGLSALLASVIHFGRRWLHAFALLALLLGVSTTASALLPAGGNEYSTGRVATEGLSPEGAYGWFATPMAACSEYAARLAVDPFNLPRSAGTATGASGTWPEVSTGCSVSIDRGTSGTFQSTARIYKQATTSCPANSTAVTGGCQCSAGFLENAGQCTPNQCGQNLNKPIKVNWTIGWTRTNNDDDRKWIGGAPSVPPSGGSVCMNGCMVGVNLELAGGPYRSQEPAANGMYRTSAYFQGVGLGGACTETTTSVDKDQPIPPCPGQVGEGPDGKLGCFGTAAQPITPTNAPIPPDNKDPIAGNPPAGAIPTEGQGGGMGGAERTPAEGSGGNAGGPAAAAKPAGPGGGAGGSASGTGTATGGGVGGGTGSVGSGTGESGEEQAACGAPGQPVCAVKFDEKDVPKDGGDGMKTDKLDAEMDKRAQGIDGITNSVGKDTSWGIVPAWFNNAACVPFNLGTLPIINVPIIIDICPFKDYVDAAMSFLWVVTTFFMVVAMVGRTTSGGNT